MAINKRKPETQNCFSTLHNTYYLHAVPETYVKDICVTLPLPPKTAYFVNSAEYIEKQRARNLYYKLLQYRVLPAEHSPAIHPPTSKNMSWFYCCRPRDSARDARPVKVNLRKLYR